jgi:hypothetical protein
MNKEDVLKPVKTRELIEKLRREYELRFQRNQYANNTIIGASVVLTILISITGTSSYFKDEKNFWANPLGVSAAAWLGLTSTALLTAQRLYNISGKVKFYPNLIVRAEDLLMDFDKIKSPAELESVEERFKKLRADESENRPVEISPSE